MKMNKFNMFITAVCVLFLINQIMSLVGQNLADRPEFLTDFWSGPILASDDIREHMGEAKNGPDRRLGLLSHFGSGLCCCYGNRAG